MPILLDHVKVIGRIHTTLEQDAIPESVGAATACPSGNLRVGSKLEEFGDEVRRPLECDGLARGCLLGRCHLLRNNLRSSRMKKV